MQDIMRLHKGGPYTEQGSVVTWHRTFPRTGRDGPTVFKILVLIVSSTWAGVDRSVNIPVQYLSWQQPHQHSLVRQWQRQQVPISLQVPIPIPTLYVDSHL